MTSYRFGERTGFTLTRAGAGLLLGSREATAAYSARHANTVRRYCQPVACDVGTRAFLYDLDACAAQLRALRRVA